MGALARHAGDLSVACSSDRFGGLAVCAGVPLADVYLEFPGGRCRPNTVLAAAYDLKVFCTAVGKPPGQVRPAGVLAVITARRAGRAGGRGALRPVGPGDGPAGVPAATVRRRLPIVSGFFAFLQARGDADANPCRGGCRPADSGLVPARASRWCASPGSCRGSCPRPRWTR
jgi:hypothetical protein